ncbi:MAG TPA: TonB-dependent receptor, partial [Rhizobiaceae bacterium]|nr:TonB-dependent receptor [Rhizobiaceae bacterium]
MTQVFETQARVNLPDRGATAPRAGNALRQRCLPALTLLLLSSAAIQAHAQDVTELETIIVTSTRTGEDPFETLSGSTGISRDRLQLEAQGGSVSEIVTLIPGMTTQTTAQDPGTGINIRGMQDFGRVNVMIDGARQNFQKNGHEANGTFYVDTEMLSKVDVTRGPASSIYGSGAIGGVVNFGTITADDLLEDGEQLAARLKTAYHYNGSGPLLHGQAAWQPSEAFDLTVAGTWKQIGDYTSGGGRTINSGEGLLSGLAKARIRPTDDQEITFSALRYLNSWESDNTRKTDVAADTYSAGYRYTPEDSDFWDFTAKIYHTGTDLSQAEFAGPDIGESRSFEIGTTGVDVFNTSRFDTGAVGHELTYGGDFFRDRVDTDDPTGTSDDLTPSGNRLAWGAFVQDHVRFDEWLEVLGALRYDSYSMRSDAVSSGGGRLSPKITIGVTPWEPVTFYGTYAEGYRAPALTEMFIDGLHPPPVSAGRFFPNPNLRPEIARTIEAGVNLRFDDAFAEGDSLRLKAGVFRNDVDDYIDQVFVMFPIPGGYQYQNVAKARVEGIEIEASYDAGNVFGGLAIHLVEGTNLITGDPLQKVPPHRLVATLGFRAFEERLT